MKVDYFTDQGVGLMNEDDFLIKNNLFCVFDGVTSLVKYIDPNGQTGGKLGSFFVKETFKNNSNKSFEEIIKLATNRLSEEMHRRNIDTSNKLNLWGSTLATVRISSDVIEYAQVGDTPIIFFKKDNFTEVIKASYKTDLEFLKLYKKLTEEGVKDVRKDQRFIDKVNDVREGVNVKYGTINGEEEVINFVIYGKVATKDVANILLMTDGVKAFEDDFEKEEDFTTLEKLYLGKGLHSLLEYTRTTENNDPNCEKYPRFKVHDDATAIGIQL